MLRDPVGRGVHVGVQTKRLLTVPDEAAEFRFARAQLAVDGVEDGEEEEVPAEAPGHAKAAAARRTT